MTGKQEGKDDYEAYLWLVTLPFSQMNDFEDQYGSSDIRSNDLSPNQLKEWTNSYASFITFVRLSNQLLIFLKEKNYEKLNGVLSAITPFFIFTPEFIREEFTNLLLIMGSDPLLPAEVHKEIIDTLTFIYGKKCDFQPSFNASDYNFSTYNFEQPIKLLDFYDSMNSNSFVNMLKWFNDYKSNIEITNELQDLKSKINEINEALLCKASATRITLIPIVP